MRLLLIEDDELWGQGLRDFLRGEGHAVEWAHRLSDTEPCRSTLSTPGAQVLCVQDDGSGVRDERRPALQQALGSPRHEGRTGAGLKPADRVARAHGGTLRQAAAPRAFAAVQHPALS